MENFDSFYQEKLLPSLTELEGERKVVIKKLVKLRNILLMIGIPLLLLFIFVVLLIEGIIGVVIVAAGIYWWMRNRYSKEYNHGFKTRVLGVIVKFIDENLTFDHTSMVTESEFDSTKIFKQRCDRYKGEDLVYGTVGKTDIRFSEIHAEYKTTSTDSNGNRKTTWHTIFKGILFKGDFNKEFKSEVYVFPDTLEKRFGKLGQKFQSAGKSRGNLVKLEDPEFEKEFAIYSKDQVEARYILSTSLMQRILDFKRKAGEKIHMSFINSTVNIAISMNKDLFEARLNKTLLDYDYIKSNLDYFMLFIGIVEDLNLNTRIWTKE